MIIDSELVSIGHVRRTHGVGGELALSLTIDTEELEALRCVILRIDGIATPFFISSLRGRGGQGALVKFDGIVTPEQAAACVGCEVFGLKDDVSNLLADKEDDEDGMYASDLIGYEAIREDDHNSIGRIIDVDDTTANVLFVIEDSDGSTVLIPVADEFIMEIDESAQRIVMNLPDGLI